VLFRSIGLLDNTIKVFYDDSLKFFLSLYGHKLPVMCIDMSYDCKILVSGSADKTIKIWGLDFGDCHRSLIGHTDSVTSIKFQPDTHYFFSGGKDGLVKYWDADRFEQVLSLPGHNSSVWSLSVSYDGALCISGGQDRSLRVWERGEDLVFVEEERERQLESLVAKTLEGQGKAEDDGAVGEAGVTHAGVKTIDSVKGGELIMEALDLAEAEIASWEAAQAGVKAGRKVVYQPSVLLQNQTPYKYMLRRLRMVKAPDLEQALLVLPFHYVTRLISMLLQLALRGLDIEMCSRCCVFLLRCHFSQIVSTQSLLEEIAALEDIVRDSVGDFRSMVGTNAAGLKVMARQEDERKSAFKFGEPDPEPEPKKKEGRQKNKKQQKKRGGGAGGGATGKSKKPRN